MEGQKEEKEEEEEEEKKSNFQKHRVKLVLKNTGVFSHKDTDKNTLIFYTQLNACQSGPKFISMAMELTKQSPIIALINIWPQL